MDLEVRTKNFIGIIRFNAGFESRPALVCGGSPTAEAMDLKSIQCGFESHSPHHRYELRKRRI